MVWREILLIKSGKKGKKQILVSEIDEIYNIKLHQCIIAGPKIGNTNKKRRLYCHKLFFE